MVASNRVNSHTLFDESNQPLPDSGRTVSIIFSFLINRLFLKFVRTLGIRNQDDTVIPSGSQSKPAVGGFSFYIIYLLSVIAYSIFFDSNQVFPGKGWLVSYLRQLAAFWACGLTRTIWTISGWNSDTGYLCSNTMVTGTLEITLSYVGTGQLCDHNFLGCEGSWTVWIYLIAWMRSPQLCVDIRYLICPCCDGISSEFEKKGSDVYGMILIGVMAALIARIFVFHGIRLKCIWVIQVSSWSLAAIGVKYLWNVEPPSDDLSSFLVITATHCFPDANHWCYTVVINRLMKVRVLLLEERIMPSSCNISLV